MAVPALKDNAAMASEIKKIDDAGLFDMGKVDSSELGSPESFRYKILTLVLGERYDRAIEELKDFLDEPSEYPDFKGKITRFIHHGIDLIYAIKAKRGFPGINSLTRAKQQELREKFKEHFKELQYILKTIEKIQTDLRIADARSTIYVVRALCAAALGIIILAFWMDIVHGLAQTSVIVFDDAFGRLANWLVELVGL
ncbi:hypothetical protein DOM22_09880 [Bdellovibrio sp. ZAP7]|uniref:hypothetical protein n=1 Tax=Bdellovibrio sp. ZAP7 TaxID=2231053 RepID=UPI0011573F12|nr:hypothetical protein [Bdellovibrio sp. ZAP7]QDK45436.1 hypothetical protein DOM22_09880 [Bdellovibrio sp. ZAP7]